MSKLSPRPRWTELRDEALDRLVERARSIEYHGFREHLLEACADVVALSRGRPIVFVGRSPEPLRDLLIALFERTKRRPRMVWLPISYRLDSSRPLSESALTQFEALVSVSGISPAEIAVTQRSVCFVDVVAWGITFENLEDLYLRLAERSGFEPQRLRPLLHYAGLVAEDWGWGSWRQDPAGERLFREQRAQVIAVPRRLWGRLGNAPKTLERYPPELWGSAPRPSPDDQGASAVKLARDLAAFGRDTDVRRDFATRLARRAEGRDARWLRQLSTSLRGSTNSRRWLSALRRSRR